MNIADLTLFVRTADCGSITRAAEQLALTPATASAGLKRLEKQMGVALFIRSTRQLRLTTEGERFLLYCRKALANLDAGQAAIHAMTGKVAGELRISAPSDIGRNLLMGWLDDIMAQHRDLSVNLMLGDSIADFYQDRFDLAIRYGPLPDSSMVSFNLAMTERIFVAAPEYLSLHGEPKSLADLAQHNCLMFQVNNRVYDEWEVCSTSAQSVERGVIKVTGDRSTNDADVVHRWALAGKGIAYKARLDMLQDIQAGRVVQLLSAFHSPQFELNLCCPTRQQVTPNVLLLRDLLRVKVSDYVRSFVADGTMPTEL